MNLSKAEFVQFFLTDQRNFLLTSLPVKQRNARGKEPSPNKRSKLKAPKDQTAELGQ